jgi:uncharacterized protein (DUF302 family)
MSTAGLGFESGSGIERAQSTRGFDETVAHFERLLAAKSMMLFAKIDFTGDAAKAGLVMPRMMQIVFGNPKGGTPVMVAAPTSALDLPLRVVISEEDGGKVWISFNSPEYLAARHGIPQELVGNIAGIRALVGAAAV